MPRSPPRTRDRAVVDLPGQVAIASRNHRSWVTATRARFGRVRRRHEVLGEPGHPFDVEVVGRLVEEQQVGVGDEQRRQRQPPALTARERSDDRRRGRRRRRPSTPPSSPSRTSRTGRRRPTRARADHRRGPRARWRRVEPSAWPSSRRSAPPGSPGRSRRPRVPASTRSRVDLPPPLRPTMPIRSAEDPGRGRRVEDVGHPEREGRARPRRGWPSLRSGLSRAWGDDVGAVDRAAGAQ
jgi:hypothetical protein